MLNKTFLLLVMLMGKRLVIIIITKNNNIFSFNNCFLILLASPFPRPHCMKEIEIS
jgi:hypothetical protein